jgi:hypothetical protein
VLSCVCVFSNECVLIESTAVTLFSDSVVVGVVSVLLVHLGFVKNA